MISAVGMMMRKVTAEMSPEGVMAEVGVVEVNVCVITFTNHPPLPDRHMATAVEPSWLAVRAGESLRQTSDPAAQRNGLMETLAMCAENREAPSRRPRVRNE